VECFIEGWLSLCLIYCLFILGFSEMRGEEWRGCWVLVRGEERRRCLGLCSPGDSSGCPVWLEGVRIYTGCPLDCLGYIKFTNGVEI